MSHVRDATARNMPTDSPTKRRRATGAGSPPGRADSVPAHYRRINTRYRLRPSPARPGARTWRSLLPRRRPWPDTRAACGRTQGPHGAHDGWRSCPLQASARARRAWDRMRASFPLGGRPRPSRKAGVGLAHWAGNRLPRRHWSVVSSIYRCFPLVGGRRPAAWYVCCAGELIGSREGKRVRCSASASAEWSAGRPRGRVKPLAELQAGSCRRGGPATAATVSTRRACSQTDPPGSPHSRSAGTAPRGTIVAAGRSRRRPGRGARPRMSGTHDWHDAARSRRLGGEIGEYSTGRRAAAGRTGMRRWAHRRPRCPRPSVPSA